jgi:hypothetical protein
MATVVQLFTRRGAPLVSVECVANYASIINDVGRAEITIPKIASLATENNLRSGNGLYIEHESAGKWGGYVDETQPWYSDRIQIVAYTAENILKRRNARSARYTGQAGAIFTQIISDSNISQHTGLYPISAANSGPAWTEPAQDGNLFQILARVAKRSGQEWSVQPRTNASGQLIFDAYWFEQQGRATNLVLQEGDNIEELAGSPLMTRQGKVVNRWFIRANHGRAIDEATVEDTASINKYGLSEDSKTVSLPYGISAADYGAILLKSSKAPRRTFRIVALDKNDTFKGIALGNTCRLQLQRYGHSGGVFGTDTNVRIKATEFNETSGRMVLTVDEVIV